MFNPFDQAGADLETVGIDPNAWVSEPVAPRGGWLSSGLSAGVHELAGLGGSAVQATGKMFGMRPVEDFGRGIADRQQAAAAAAGRPDLEVAPWRDGGASWLPYIGYQAAKNVPLIAGQLAAGALVPEALVPSALSRAGAFAPKLVGGGGLKAGADFAAKKAAVEAGKDFGRSVTGAAIAGYPAAVGSMYQEAAQREKEGGAPASQQDAVWAAAMGVPYAVLDALGPAQLKGLARPAEGGVKDFVKHTLTAGGAGALEEIPQEALQTAMEQSFRTDLPVTERMQNVVDAALTGGLIGGVFGGAAGGVGNIRHINRASAQVVDTEHLDEATKEILEPEAAAPAVPEEPAPQRPFGDQPDAALAQAGLVASPEDQAAINEEIATRNRYATHGDEELVQAARSLNPEVPEERAQLDEIMSEMQTRQNRGSAEPVRPSAQAVEPQAETGQASAPKAETAAEAPAAPGIRDQFLMAAGRGGKGLAFMKEVGPEATTADALTKLRLAYDEGRGWDRLPASLKNIMQAFGVADAKGKAANLDKQISALQTKIDNAQGKTEKNPGMAKRVADWTAQRDQLSYVKTLWNEVDHAIQKQGAAGEALRNQPDSGEGVREGNPEGGQIAGEGRQEVVGQEAAGQEPAVEGASPQEQNAAPAQGNDLTDAGPASVGIGVLRDATPEEIAAAKAERQRMWDDLNQSAGSGKEGFASPATPGGTREKLIKSFREKGTSPFGPNNPTVFRLADQKAGGSGMSDAAFNRVMENTMKSLGPNLSDRVTVVPDEASLPAEVHSDAAQQKVDITGLHGVIRDGKVYLVRKNLKSPGDVQNTLRHEILGHGGASALFGEGRTNALAAIFDKAGGVDQLQKAAKALKVDTDISAYLPEDIRSGGRTLNQLNDDEKAMLADELLAQVSGEATDEHLAMAAGENKGKFRRVLEGWVDKMKQALSSALKSAGFGALAKRIDSYSPKEMARTLREMHAAARSGAEWTDDAAAYKLGSIKGVNDATKGFVKKVTDLLDKTINSRDVKGAVRGGLLPAMSILHIDAHYGKMFNVGKNNPTGEYMQGNEARTTAKARFAQLFDDAYRKISALPNDVQDRLQKIMAYTALEIDPAKSWKQHDWLHGLSNEDRLKQLVDEANADLRWLKQKKGFEAYEAAKAHNEMQRYGAAAQALHNAVTTDEFYAALPLANSDPMEEFLRTSSLHTDVNKARGFWKSALDKRLQAIQSYLKEKQDAVASDEAKGEELRKRTDDVATLAGKTAGMIKAMERTPYFHLGRNGDYMVTFSLKTDAEKNVDVAATSKVVDRVKAAGFDDVVISADQNNGTAFIRVDTRDQAETLYNLARTLQQEGLLGDRAIKRGSRFDEDVTGKITQQWMDRILDRVRSSFEPTEEMSKEEKAVLAENRDRAVSQLKSMFLDLLPDTSLAKVMAKRDYVTGFSKNMIRSFAFRAQVGANALSNMYASRKVTTALNDMREAIKQAKSDPKADIYTMQQVFGELMTRETTRPYKFEQSPLDTLRALNHAYYLGFSPSYVALNMTQLGALLLPELAKHNSFLKSATTIGRVTGPAFAVLKATFDEGKAVGWKRAADAIITRSALDKALGAGDDARKEFLMRAVNRGNIDIGSAARELARAADGRQDSQIDMALRYAASFGYYSETFTRLVAALSAYELHGDKTKMSLDNYADHVVNQSMLNYAQWNTARAIGRQGVVGKFSPLAFSFMNYQMQVLEKLYREFYDAAHGDKEARRFLGAHLAAMTAISGTLGLPFAAVAAGAADKLRDLLGDDDDERADTANDIRNFYAQIFGKDMGEILSHGAFRAAGVDISQRAGEQNLFPGTKLLTDKRKMEDAIKDWAFGMYGAPASMLTNMLIGLRDISNGNVIDGAKEFMPTAFKGLIEAYRMAQEGYVDKQGRALPMTAGATDILAQALGFTPANKAVYQEQRHTLQVRKDVALQRSNVIRQHLAVAMEKGDQDAIEKWSAEAHHFDQAHPGYEIMPHMGAVLGKRAKARELSQRNHLPIEANIKDRGAADATYWANWR